MTPRTLFKVVIRSIGLVLLVMALPKLPAVWTQFAEIRRVQQMAAAGYAQKVLPETYLPLCEELIRLALGFYLLFFGNWLLARVGPPAGSCGECGYSLAGSPPFGRCPECGTPYGPPPNVPIPAAPSSSPHGPPASTLPPRTASPKSPPPQPPPSPPSP